MAVLPPKNAAKAKGGAGARFRQRKISVKVPLHIYNQKDIASSDADLEPSQLHHINAGASQQPRDVHSVETGVDKNEEDEVHLQQVINAAQRVLMGSVKNDKKDGEGKEDQSVYIPTPDASKLWKDAKKYYDDNTFVEPEAYIKFSATVEDTLGVEYNIDEEDEKFLNEVLNKEYPKASKKKKEGGVEVQEKECSEIEFETIMAKFEKTIEEKQPFLSVDPSIIMSYAEILAYILEEFRATNKAEPPFLNPGANLNYMSTTKLKETLSKELDYRPYVTLYDKNPEQESSFMQTRPITTLLDLFGEPVFEHWKKRKIERKGKPISPQLKFEDPNANEKDNDNDPYICFRRREFRQARKTRRADNLGAERIRHLQRSLRKARDLVLSVCKRELLKQKIWQSDFDIFKARCETKNIKRAVGVKGDDHLFFPHKRRKIVKIEPEEDEEEEEESAVTTKSRKEKKRAAQDTEPATASAKDKQANGQAQTETSSNQPYVKLPPSKIPDMDLVTVNLVLKEKNETIKRAVLEKMRKRKESDKGFVNLTYDPYQPFFNITTNDSASNMDLRHIPYSSIASSFYHQVNTSNVLNDNLKKLVEDAKKPLPGIKTFRGSNGDLIPSKPFQHLHTLLNDHVNTRRSSSGYIAHLLSSIQNNDFSSYTNGFAKQSEEELDEEYSTSEPIFRMRKRIGRANQLFIDRRELMRRPDDAISEWILLDKTVGSDEGPQENKTPEIPDAYDCKRDAVKRMDSRWKFDSDCTESEYGIRHPFSLDPSRLNSISDDTQSIRFGSMLLSKSYDLLRENAHQRQLLIQQARMRAIQQHQLNSRNHLSSSSSGSENSQTNGQVANQHKMGTPASGYNGYKKGGPGGGDGPNAMKTLQQALQQIRKQQNQHQLNQAYLAQRRTPGPYGGSPPASSASLYNNNNYPKTPMPGGEQ